MSALIGISLWIVLVTVLPGMVAIAAMYGAFELIYPDLLNSGAASVTGPGEWAWASLAVTIMILTQAVGIIQEKLFITKQWLGSPEQDLEIPGGIDPLGETSVTIRPYDEYRGLYLLLAELREDEDTQGHLKRCVAQFFLTNNTLVALAAGIATSIGLMILVDGGGIHVAGAIYIGLLAVAWLVSFQVAKIRFGVMGKTLWAARRRRLKTAIE